MKLIRRWSFWSLTMFGILLLLTVAAKLGRPGSDRVELAGVGLCVVGIWATFLHHERTLTILEGLVDERALDRLSGAADSLGGFDYLILLLILIH
jgi:hypothetical protein